MTTARLPAGTQVFRIRGDRARDRVLLLFTVLGLVPIVGVLVLAYRFEALARVVWLPEFLLMALALPVVIGASLWWDRRFREAAKLTVDDRGVRLAVDIHSAIAPFWKGREIRWNEMAPPLVMRSFGVVQLRRKGAFSVPLRLRMADWVPEGASREPRDARIPPPAMRETDLWKALAARGLFVHEDPAQQPFDFDLAKHPATRGLLIAAGLLAAYWAVDGYFAGEAWAEWSPRYLAPHGVAGVVGALAAFAILRAARKPSAVPGQAVAFIGVVFGVVVALASWTGLIRVNQALGGPLVEERYLRNASCDTLVPLKAGLPSIEYTAQARDFWCQVPPDRHIIVPVREGLGGLYQVDLRRHTQAIRYHRQLAR